MSFSTAPRTDAEFRPFLDQDLTMRVFQVDSTAQELENALNALVDERVVSTSGPDEAINVRHLAASAIRKVLVIWGIDAPLGTINKHGDLVDKFTLGYNAVSTLGKDRDNEESMPWQIVKCFTSAYKNEHELTPAKYQDIKDAGAKVYLRLMHYLDAQAGSATRDRDPAPETATYTAFLEHPLSKKDARPVIGAEKIKAGGLLSTRIEYDDDGVEVTSVDNAPKKTKAPNRSPPTLVKQLNPLSVRDTADEDVDDAKDETKDLPQPKRAKGAAAKPASGPKRVRKVRDKSTVSANTSDTAPRRGNFTKAAGIPWYPDEELYARQLIRDHPGYSWPQYAEDITARFRGTQYWDETTSKFKKETREVRTTGAVRQHLLAHRSSLDAGDGADARDAAEAGGDQDAVSGEDAGEDGEEYDVEDVEESAGTVAATFGEDKGQSEEPEVVEEESDHETPLDDLEEMVRRG